MRRLFLIVTILAVSITSISSQNTFDYSLSIGETTMTISNELGFGMPDETTSEYLIPVTINETEQGYKLTFGSCTESLVIDGKPVPPVVSVNSILADKEINATISEEEYAVSIPDLSTITREFNPIDPNLLTMILFPPIDDIISTGESEMILDFPRVSEEGQSVNETFAVNYTYTGESEFAGYNCYVVNMDFEGDENGKIAGPLGDTVSTGMGSGSGMLMYSSELGITIWADLQYELERVKNITLNNQTYILEEKTGYGMSISPADEEE